MTGQTLDAVIQGLVKFKLIVLDTRIRALNYSSGSLLLMEDVPKNFWPKITVPRPIILIMVKTQYEYLVI